MSNSSKRASKRIKRDTVWLDFAKIEELLRESRRSFARVADDEFADVSRTKWYEIRKGEKPTDRAVALRIADALNVDLSRLLKSEQEEEPSRVSWPEHPEWAYVTQNARWEHTSNGLYFFRCKVRHKHIGDVASPRFGQARVYDLTRVPDRDRSTMKELLTRHALVCSQLAEFPQFVTNLSVTPLAGGTVWWVVDEWLDGQKLRDLTRDELWSESRVHGIMRQVAEGLQALHRHKIVVRELSPNKLLLDANDRIRFLELDLAKLLFHDKTVSAEWHDTDPYRAPEVEGGAVTAKADLFSWGMIYLHSLSRDCSLGRRDLDQTTLEPSELKTLIRRCLSPSPRSRPASIDAVLKSLYSISVE